MTIPEGVRGNESSHVIRIPSHLVFIRDLCKADAQTGKMRLPVLHRRSSKSSGDIVNLLRETHLEMKAPWRRLEKVVAP